MTRFSSSTAKDGSGVARNFKRGGINFHIFSSVFFSSKFCLNFLTLILGASPNMMHFVRTFLIMRA